MKFLFKYLFILAALVCVSTPAQAYERDATEFYFYISSDTDIISIEDIGLNNESQISSQGLIVFQKLLQLSQGLSALNTAFHFYIDTNEKLDLNNKQSQIIRVKNSKIIENKILGETNSHDSRWIQELTSTSLFDSKRSRRILVMWGHGQGWEPLSNFDHSHYTESFDLLSFVKHSYGKWDAIIFDACQMGSLEVLVDLKNKTNYVLASQFNFPADGINYENLATSLQHQENNKDFVLNILEDLQLQTLKKQKSKKQFAPPVIYNLAQLSLFLDIFDQHFNLFIEHASDTLKEEIIHFSQLTTIKPFTDLPYHLIDVRAFYHQLKLKNLVSDPTGLNAMKAVLNNGYGSISFSFENSSKYINKKQLLESSNRTWGNLAPWRRMRVQENL